MARLVITLMVVAGVYLAGVVFNLIRGGIQARRFAKSGHPVPPWHMVCAVQTCWLSWLLPILELVARKKGD